MDKSLLQKVLCCITVTWLLHSTMSPWVRNCSPGTQLVPAHSWCSISLRRLCRWAFEWVGYTDGWMDVSFLFLRRLLLWLEPRTDLLPTVPCPPPIPSAKAPALLTWEAEKEQNWGQPHGSVSLAGAPSKSRSLLESRCLRQSLRWPLSTCSSFLCVSVSHLLPFSSPSHFLIWSPT